MIESRSGGLRGTWLAIGAGVVAIAVGLVVWVGASWIRSTNDAFVDGDIVLVVAENAGRVEKIEARDNSSVRQGDRLLEMDTQDLKLSLDEATADAGAAQA